MSELSTPPRADSEAPFQGLSAAVVVRLASAGEGAFGRLLALLGALAPVLRRVVLVEEGAGGRVPVLPGLARCAVPAGTDAGAALRAGVAAALEPGAVEVLVFASDEIAGWRLDEVELADARALEIVARLGGIAGWLGDEPERELRPGLAVCSVAAWMRLAPSLGARLRAGAVRTARLPLVDLRALARLADLGVPPAAVSADLATGLTRVRDRLARVDPRLDRRFALDEASIPPSIRAGEPLALRISGWIAHVPQPERLELSVGARRIEIPVEASRPDVLARFPDLADDRCGFRVVAAVGGLAAGRHAISIGLPGRRATRRLGAVRVLPAGERDVVATAAKAEPVAVPGEPTVELRVERCAAVPDGLGGWRLEIAGELAGPAPVDTLTLAVDGVERVDVDPRAFVALGAAPGRARRSGFRLEQALGGTAGRRELALRARRGRAELARWHGEVELPDAERTAVALASADLERLRRASPAFVHGALVVEGSVAGAPAGAEVVLELGGAEATAAALDANRRFRIAHRMGEGERAEAECIVRAGGAELARSGRFAVVARPFALSARAVDDLEAVRAALDPLPAALRDADARDLLRAIVELRPAERGEIEAALAQLAARAAAARSRPAELAPELPPRPERSLRVLFVTTEIPWSGHGGGVSTSNLLRHLGARHELTLLHPVHPGAEGLSEEVRGFVRELVTAPRGWQPAPSPAPYGVPVESLRTFSPELRAAVAAELGSGRYDLANFEFSAASLYAPPAGARDLLVIHESRSFALLAESSPRSGSELDLAAWTARLLAALTFETVELPGRFRDLATLTAPEARCLAAFLPGHRLHVNPIAIDVESLAARSAAAAAPERPTFVYVGNFRHPPNRDAAGVLVDEVAPLLLRRSPGARIVIAGDRAPAELVESARRARVEHLGWVEDLPRLLGGATAFLAPIRTGAGMRVKHLEAMACGCPIVTTALGMSGIAAADGREYLQAESAEELVDGALRLAGDAALRARLADSARELVARDHAPAVQGERRERIWAAVLGAAASRDAG